MMSSRDLSKVAQKNHATQEGLPPPKRGLMAVLINKLIPCKKGRKAAATSIVVLEGASCSSKREGERRFQSHCLGDAKLVEKVKGTIPQTPWNINWEDIAELEETKTDLQTAIDLLRVAVPPGMRRFCRHILLFGPPGTGKSLLAKATASNSSTTIFHIQPSTFASVSKEESARMIELLFEMARFHTPSTIFIDHIDSLFPKSESGLDIQVRQMVTSALRIQMDENVSDGGGDDVDRRVMVLATATTKKPCDVDEGLRWAFGKRIDIPLPNRE